MAAVPSPALPRRVLLELTPSEAAFQARVIALARSLGYLAYHTHFSKHSEKGFPDLALCRIRDGRLILAELKVWPRLALRPEQEVWLEALGRNPHLEVYVWRWEWPGDVMREIAEVLGR